ncbi:site-2 protease family protein [Cytobacillus sp. IB215665]|uniref:site-2 protease family protein n=1 Tax=Cytobacillus sp. IB215665 TaxID=3097357 RepID=UPI002A0EE368|nr:site-2 protease family protein [Cytobacillus sp. IB215665]MDX8365645.1 hypothetical protein [Cytobacillus sp. IB215665]
MDNKGMTHMSKFFSPLNVCIISIVIAIALSFTSYAEMTNLISLSFYLLIVLFIHELGHVIGGKLAGYKFLFMTVGPITIERNPNLKVIPNNNWVAFGGLASCVPTEKNLTNLLKRHKIFVAGGPILTAIASIISLLIWHMTEYEIAMIFTILNTVIFFATIVPFQGSDGSILLSLQKGGKEAETHLATLLLMKEMMSPKNPIDWDKQLVKEAQNVDVSSDTITNAYLLFYYHLVTDNYYKASESIELYKQLPITKKTKMNLQFITHS